MSTVLQRARAWSPTTRIRPAIRSLASHVPHNRPQIVETATWWLSSSRVAAHTVERLLGTEVSSVERLGVHGQRRVLLAHTAGGPVVLHLTLNHRYACQLEWAFAFADRHEIPSPRLLASATDALAVPRFGAWAVAVSFVTGEPLLGPHRPGELARLGALLGRIHAIPASAAGSDAPQERSAYDLHWLDFSAARRAEIGRLLARCGRRTGGLVASTCDRLADAARSVDLGERHLVHGDAHPGNVLATPDGGLTLLDLESLRFGISELELHFVLEQYCGSDREQRGALLGGYRSTVGAEKWRRWTSQRRFWHDAGTLNLLELQLGILLRARSEGEIGHVRNMSRVVDGTLRRLADRSQAIAA